jgi:hypothetical protein
MIKMGITIRGISIQDTFIVEFEAKATTGHTVISWVAVDPSGPPTQINNDIKAAARADIIAIGGPDVANNDILLFGALV